MMSLLIINLCKTLNLTKNPSFIGGVFSIYEGVYPIDLKQNPPDEQNPLLLLEY